MPTKNMMLLPRGMLSKEAEYALKIVLYVAKQPFDKYVTGREIAVNQMMPVVFVSGIISTLTGGGLLQSKPGPKGGVRLSRTRSLITLFDVVKLIDGTAITTACIIGHQLCTKEQKCVLHDAWIPVRDRIQQFLMSTTLAIVDQK